MPRINSQSQRGSKVRSGSADVARNSRRADETSAKAKGSIESRVVGSDFAIPEQIPAADPLAASRFSNRQRDIEEAIRNHRLRRNVILGYFSFLFVVLALWLFA